MTKKDTHAYTPEPVGGGACATLVYYRNHMWLGYDNE